MGEYCDAHGEDLPDGWEDHVKKIFDHVDKNGNGEVDMDEFKAAVKEYEEEEGKGGKKGGKKVQMKQKLLNVMSKIRKGPTVEDVFNHIDANGDGVLTLDEVIKAIQEYCDAHGEDLPDGWEDHVKKIFDH